MASPQKAIVNTKPTNLVEVDNAFFSLQLQGFLFSKAVDVLVNVINCYFLLLPKKKNSMNKIIIAPNTPTTHAIQLLSGLVEVVCGV